jgi:hypothetical protein
MFLVRLSAPYPGGAQLPLCKAVLMWRRGSPWRCGQSEMPALPPTGQGSACGEDSPAIVAVAKRVRRGRALASPGSVARAKKVA